MATSSGKKGKKTKGTVLSLQTFLSNGDMPPLGTTQVAKNVRNINGDDSDDGDNMLTFVCQLPTAPRANRVFDENQVSYKQPFIAYVTNLPFDINEEDIYDFFNNNNIISVRLPREDGETGRVRGFGYIEFETRDDLIHALGLPDPSIKGRRIRIELSNETEQNQRQRGSRRNFDTSNNFESKESTNWRRDNQKKDYDYERVDQKSSYSEGTTGSWRSRNRHGEGKQLTSTHSENLRDTMTERPRLNLKPRTLPLADQDIASIKIEITNEKTSILTKNSGASAEKIFGSAKPVDTSARDLAMEQRLSDIRRQECIDEKIDVSISTINNIHIQSDHKQPILESNWRKGPSSDELNKTIENERDAAKDNRSGRYDNSKEMQEDGKHSEVSEDKRAYKVGRALPRYSSKSNESMLVSSNKYSGLDEDLD